MLTTLRCEWRVAFSRKGQPVPVRLTKWALSVAVAAALYRAGAFRLWTAGLPLLCVAVNFVYSWRTRGWTRTWGRLERAGLRRDLPLT